MDIEYGYDGLFIGRFITQDNYKGGIRFLMWWGPPLAIQTTVAIWRIKEKSC